jgi:ribonuclease E
MLIDASQDEETRVAIAERGQLKDFDFTTLSKLQIKGNIYLAKVTRVEPSLQAAFVEYGGGRQGFLAFSEIHPDYYQIPVADRQALIEQQIQEQREAIERREKEEEEREKRRSKQGSSAEQSGDDASAEDGESEGDDIIEKPGSEEESDFLDAESPDNQRRNFRPRRYRIQEVIKRNQVMLIQVVKEERGNKGAAVTSYISLPGRYCVLMPNTPDAGGISRKINDSESRRRLKEILEGLTVPQGMGVILRTAGLDRNKTEIRRDFDYLVKLWNTIREQTIKSVAPSLIYEEGNLIKRSIRDLYTPDIDEILVEGEEAYKDAKNLMKLMMPSHAAKVKQYKEEIPLFTAFDVEPQLQSIQDPIVKLSSGGYIVIDSTEALVAIDVNSGRSTGERNIEETAYRTNLEAASEVARQLRLRDLAGLIVIDFIDMMNFKNRRTVEKRMKDCLSADRAKIQLGRISQFGLMEMTRQRLRPSITETLMEDCPNCGGTGHVRSSKAQAMQILRTLDQTGMNYDQNILKLNTSREMAMFLLNNKRKEIIAVEEKQQIKIDVGIVDSLPYPGYQLIGENGQILNAPASNDSKRRDDKKGGKGRDRRPERTEGRDEPRRDGRDEKRPDRGANRGSERQDDNRRNFKREHPQVDQPVDQQVEDDEMLESVDGQNSDVRSSEDGGANGERNRREGRRRGFRRGGRRDGARGENRGDARSDVIGAENSWNNMPLNKSQGSRESVDFDKPERVVDDMPSPAESASPETAPSETVKKPARGRKPQPQSKAKLVADASTSGSDLVEAQQLSQSPQESSEDNKKPARGRVGKPAKAKAAPLEDKAPAKSAAKPSPRPSAVVEIDQPRAEKEVRIVSATKEYQGIDDDIARDNTPSKPKAGGKKGWWGGRG